MSVVIIGDTHHPFADKKCLNGTYEIIESVRPTHVVQIGDLYDMYSFAKYPRNPNFITPEAECVQGRAAAEEMWDRVKKVSPKSKRWQLKGNHDVRPAKMAAAIANATLHVMRKFVKDQMTFDGVELVDDEHEIDGIVYEHGYLTKDGAHAVENQQSTVRGHSHRPGLYCFRNKHGPFFELNVGCLIDFSSEAFDYRAKKKWHKMTHALGLIDNMGPRFIFL